MEYLLKIAVIMVISAGFSAGLRALSARQKPIPEADGSHRIVINRTVIIVVVALCLALAGAGFFGATVARPGQVAPALMIGGVFAVFGLLTATSLTRAYDVRWDDIAITGPASYGIWPFGPRHTTIRFADIVTAGTDWMGSDYVTDDRGEKLRWNYSYAGHTALKAALARARPDLFPEEATNPPDRSP